MTEYQSLCAAFASRNKPEHFTDYMYCEENAEHDDTLLSKDNDTISFQDVGNIAYSPISFTSIEGFLYYLPGLARLATGTGEEYFLDTFLVYLENEERRNALNGNEKKALSKYLAYLGDSIQSEIQENLDTEDLVELINWLEQK
ncbi:hypothetical protein KO495_00765 [Colwellia sp. D2M02]|uniref:hypothetical protein n=1 Tax=Colwellia sp. D2M02 TaxID=2841562 RepID=UPI001C092B68|nr:hypothetical protein [Colwellia sp. D2M02]MBU2891849.1 hypothetical protein [Colwellia sp. D2M02]